ncbi:MAG TPA: hypothetical protein VNN72_15445 [Polyangiaceae bacterium]|nr:hypothetical protein [Polyangiaceae bacterium]
MGSGLLSGALVLAALGTACSSSSSSVPPSDAAQVAVADASARLEGRWVLIEFQPDAPLEPMLATWLTSQMNQLQVSFHAGAMHIEGVGVSVDRNYRVTQAAADGFSLTVVDPTNVEYRSTCAFQGNVVAFTSLSDPWRGHGRLQRLP